jgi:heat shock protein HslJ
MNTTCSRSRARKSAAITFLLLTIAAPFGDTAAWTDGVFREALSNMTYPSQWTGSGRAPLVGGVYKEPAAPGSTSNIVIRLADPLAIGIIGEQTMAALVIVTDPGGSGIFFDLYLVRGQDNRWSIVDHAHLGDRIGVNKIEFDRGLVGLDLTVHGPRDSACCPTERSRVYYALQDERLVKVSTPAQKTPSPIEGPVWAWQYTQRADGTRTTPAESGHYTLRLGPDRRLDVRADCNRAGGHYLLDGARLTLSVTHSTMAACPPESLDKQFLADVAVITTWSVEEGLLRVNLLGGGMMTFTATSQ